MREEKIYQYEELEDYAKERARDWYTDSFHYVWIDEGIDSIKTFCKHFDVAIKDYSLCPYSYSYIDTDVKGNHFRGLKLKQVDRDFMPTGYCVDSDLWITFHDVFKTTGNALRAFESALDCGKKSILNDMEYQHSEEYIAENIIINNYEFFENGSFVK